MSQEESSEYHEITPPLRTDEDIEFQTILNRDSDSGHFEFNIGDSKVSGSIKNWGGIQRGDKIVYDMKFEPETVSYNPNLNFYKKKIVNNRQSSQTQIDPAEAQSNADTAEDVPKLVEVNIQEEIQSEVERVVSKMFFLPLLRGSLLGFGLMGIYFLVNGSIVAIPLIGLSLLSLWGWRVYRNG